MTRKRKPARSTQPQLVAQVELPPRRKGRPPFAWPDDAEAQVKDKAYSGVSDKVLAAWFGCGVSTLTDRFSGVITKQRAQRKIDIAAAQTKYALAGNPALLIWTGKQSEDKGGLGQRDEVTLGGQIDMEKLSDAELEAIAAGKAKPRLKVEDGGQAKPKGEKAG